MSSILSNWVGPISAVVAGLTGLFLVLHHLRINAILETEMVTFKETSRGDYRQSFLEVYFRVRNHGRPVTLDGAEMDLGEPNPWEFRDIVRKNSEEPRNLRLTRHESGRFRARFWGPRIETDIHDLDEELVGCPGELSVYLSKTPAFRFLHSLELTSSIETPKDRTRNWMP